MIAAEGKEKQQNDCKLYQKQAQVRRPALELILRFDERV